MLSPIDRVVYLCGLVDEGERKLAAARANEAVYKARLENQAGSISALTRSEKEKDERLGRVEKERNVDRNMLSTVTANYKNLQEAVVNHEREYIEIAIKLRNYEKWYNSFPVASGIASSELSGIVGESSERNW